MEVIRQTEIKNCEINPISANKSKMHVLKSIIQKHAQDRRTNTRTQKHV